MFEVHQTVSTLQEIEEETVECHRNFLQGVIFGCLLLVVVIVCFLVIVMELSSSIAFLVVSIQHGNAETMHSEQHIVLRIVSILFALRLVVCANIG